MSATWTIPAARASDRTFRSTWTIVCLGHSYWARYTYGQLAAATQNHYRTGVNPTANLCPTWLNKGVSGEKIAQFTARISTDVTPFAPAAVLVSDPTNDLGSTSLPQILIDYNALVDGLVSAGVPAAGIGLVNQCLSGNSYPEANISTINSFNDVIQQVANAKGCCVVDVRTQYVARRVGGGGPITDDNVHPTIGTGVGVTNPNGDSIYSGWLLAGSRFAA